MYFLVYLSLVFFLYDHSYACILRIKVYAMFNNKNMDPYFSIFYFNFYLRQLICISMFVFSSLRMNQNAYKYNMSQL